VQRGLHGSGNQVAVSHKYAEPGDSGCPLLEAQSSMKVK